MDPHRAEDDMGASILTAKTVVSLFQVLSAKNRRDSVSLRKANDTGETFS